MNNADKIVLALSDSMISPSEPIREITTVSGAVYHLHPDGTIRRVDGPPLVWTWRDHQYEKGFLLKGAPVEVGKPLYWMGVLHEYTEPVRSTPITKIKEIT